MRIEPSRRLLPLVLAFAGALAGAQSLEEAEALIETRQFHAATASLTELIDSGSLETPDRARAHLLRGIAAMNRRRMGNAYADYSTAYALDASDAETQLWLGIAEKYGHSGTRNPERAATLLESASAAGLAAADYELGQMLLAASNEDPAGIAALMRAAEGGNPDAMFLLARLYEAGQIVNQDAERALFWFEQAAATGNADASFKVGMAYRFGPAVEIDADKAAGFQRTAVEAGSWEAELLEGNDLENAKDWVQANYYYWRAAESDHDPGRVNLGVGFLTGDRGLRQDYRSAFYWLSQGRGSVFGAQYAGLMLDTGLGVEQNSEAAFALIEPIAERSSTAKALTAMMLQSGRGTTADTARAARLFAALEQYETAEELGAAAWMLATHPDPAARQPELAVRLAQRTHDLDPKFDTMDTLAVAHGAAGNFTEAVQWLERALADTDGVTEAAVESAERHLASFRAGQAWSEGPFSRFEYDTPVETTRRVRAEFIGEIVALFAKNNENPQRGLDTELGESQFGLNILVQSVETGTLPYFMRDYAVFYIHSPTLFFTGLPQDVAPFSAPAGPFRFILSEVQSNGWAYDLAIEPLPDP